MIDIRRIGLASGCRSFVLLECERDDRATLGHGGGLAGIVVQVITTNSDGTGLRSDAGADCLMRNRSGL